MLVVGIAGLVIDDENVSTMLVEPGDVGVEENSTDIDADSLVPVVDGGKTTLTLLDIDLLNG